MNLCLFSWYICITVFSVLDKVNEPIYQQNCQMNMITVHRSWYSRILSSSTPTGSPLLMNLNFEHKQQYSVFTLLHYSGKERVNIW